MRYIALAINGERIAEPFKAFHLHTTTITGCDHAFFCRLIAINMDTAGQKITVEPIYMPGFAMDMRAGQLVLTAYLYRQQKIVSIVMQKRPPYATMEVYGNKEESTDEND